MADADTGDRIEVVYALPDRQDLVSLPFEEGLTAAEAVSRSGLVERHAEIGRGPLVLGVFGRRVDSAYRLKPGDRVEICRPLSRDPRAMRKELSRDGRVVGDRASSSGPRR